MGGKGDGQEGGGGAYTRLEGLSRQGGEGGSTRDHACRSHCTRLTFHRRRGRSDIPSFSPAKPRFTSTIPRCSPSTIIARWCTLLLATALFFNCHTSSISSLIPTVTPIRRCFFRNGRRRLTNVGNTFDQRLLPLQTHAVVTLVESQPRLKTALQNIKYRA